MTAIRLTLDTETALITQARPAPDLACVAIRAQGQAMLLHHTEAGLVRDMLLDPSILFVGHNIAFDWSVLCHRDPTLYPLLFRVYNEDRCTDTLIRAKLLDIAQGTRKYHEDEDGETERTLYSLEAQAQRFLGRALDKSSYRLRYGELIPYFLPTWPQGAREYPLEDVRATDDLCDFQQAFGDTGLPGVFRDEYRQARAALWIQLMAVHGIHTDAAGVEALARLVQGEYDTIERDLQGLGLVRAARTVRHRNGVVETLPGSRNTKAAHARIARAFLAQGLPIPMTKSGNDPALDETSCRESLDPVMIKYADLTAKKCILSKDIPMLRAGTRYPLHSAFDSLKENGRTGSSAPRGPDGKKLPGGNVQNPKVNGGIRECFIPRCLTCGKPHSDNDVRAAMCLYCNAGLTVFLVADYSGAELSTWAQVCLSVFGHSRLAEAINAGRDPHLMLAENIDGRPYDVLFDLYERGDNEVYTVRSLAKRVNFGLMGGAGAERFAKQVRETGMPMTTAQAKVLKEAWKRTWPEEKEYFKWINYQVSQPNPAIEQLYSGRIRGFGGDSRAYTEASNTFFSGLAADMFKDAGWRVVQECYAGPGPLLGCRIANEVHDSLMLECPESRIHEAGLALEGHMQAAARVWLPDVKVKSKPMAMRRWATKAKPVHDSQGRLAVWAA